MSNYFYSFDNRRTVAKGKYFAQKISLKKFHIVRNILFFSPTGSLKIIKFSKRFAIGQVLKVNSLRDFSVRVFINLKILLFLVSFVCTSCSSMPLFSSFSF